MSIAVMILVISLFATFLIMKTTLTSWVALVTIITFSSGMMTLFMYTASLSSNEINSMKKPFIMMGGMLALIMALPQTVNKTSISMKMFSNQLILFSMAMVMIMTMLAIASHGHHPQQTLSTSF